MAVVLLGCPASVDPVLAAIGDRVAAHDGSMVATLEREAVLRFPDPRSAVAFAAAIRREVVDHAVRLGISFGDGGGLHQLRGDAHAVATQLADRADAGEVLVSDVIRRLAGPVPGFRFVDRGRARLPGSSDRWEVHGLVPAEVPAQPAVFGRDAELEVVDELLARVLAGSGAGLLVEGEAGIGKTHLTTAMAARATSAGFVVASGAAGELEQDRPGRVIRSMAPALEVAEDELLGTAGSDAGTDPGYAVVERFTAAVERRSLQAPVLLVADDLHWADDVSLRALASVLRRIGPLAVGVVATMRPTPRSATLDAVVDLAARTGTTTVRLGPLDSAAVAGVVAALTGAAPGPRLRSHLDATGGNPLFVTELVTALDDFRELRSEGGVAETATEAVPEGLMRTLQRRLERLHDEAADVLRAASLLGAEFSLEDVAVVVGRRVVDVASALRPAVDAGLVLGDGHRLAFRHDLVREAVYRSLPAAMRADLHVAAGRSLAASGAPPEQVARQLSLGAAPGDVVAAGWLVRAAHAAATTDSAAAARWYERALQLAPTDWADRPEAEASLAELLAWSGRIEEAAALAERLLDRSLSPRERLRAHQAVATVRSTIGDVSGAHQQLDAAARLPELVDTERAVLRCAAAGMSVIAAEAPPESAAAVGDEHLHTTDPVVACWARNTLAVAAVAEGAYDDLLVHARIACGLLERGHVPGLGFLIPQTWLATALANLDDFDASAERARQAHDDGERRGDVGLVAHAGALLAGLDYMCGAWDDALARLEAGQVLVEETGVDVQLLLTHALTAAIALGRGDHDRAEEHVGRGEAFFATGRSHPFGLDLLTWVRAQLLERSGAAADASAVLAMVWERTATMRGLVQWRLFAPDLVRLRRTTGDDRGALAAASDLEALAARSSSVSARATAERARGIVDGDPAPLLAAVAHLRSTPRAVELAAACEEAAAALVAADRSDDAVVLLDEAAAIHVGMAATAAVNRVDARLRELGVRRRRSAVSAPTHGWDSLSPKEREVVQLVSNGLSNPQIAERLYISRRTVETHLSHVYGKLGIGNRTALATAVAERGGVR